MFAFKFLAFLKHCFCKILKTCIQQENWRSSILNEAVYRNVVFTMRNSDEEQNKIKARGYGDQVRMFGVLKPISICFKLVEWPHKKSTFLCFRVHETWRRQEMQRKAGNVQREVNYLQCNRSLNKHHFRMIILFSSPDCSDFPVGG
jgi:hypothetical protein